jgi:beta-lactam-binding protein with PASTA domain
VSRILSLEKGDKHQPVLKKDLRTTHHEKSDYNEEYLTNKVITEKNPNESENIFISNNLQNTMPDLRGKTIKEALLTLNEMGIHFSVSGSGVVIEQSIAPGSSIKNRKTCVLTCSHVISTGARIY